MTLDEAIVHAEEVAENKEKAIKLAKGNPDHPMLSMSEKGITEYKKCINEHRQLAEWLRNYKKLKEQEPCEDAYSKQAVLDAMRKNHRSGGRDIDGDYIEGDYRECLYDDIISLPFVNPQPKYEDIAKAFQFGLAFGFGKKYDEMDRVIDEIKKVITPQPKTGRWIIIDDCERFIAKCSECGRIEDSRMINKYPYCHCGAKMI